MQGSAGKGSAGKGREGKVAAGSGEGAAPGGRAARVHSNRICSFFRESLGAHFRGVWALLTSPRRPQCRRWVSPGPPGCDPDVNSITVTIEREYSYIYSVTVKRSSCSPNTVPTAWGQKAEKCHWIATCRIGQNDTTFISNI